MLYQPNIDMTVRAPAAHPDQSRETVGDSSRNDRHDL